MGDQRWRYLAAVACAALLVPAGGLEAAEVAVQSRQIERFEGAAVGEQVGGLIWRGGIEMTSRDEAFGGFSGLAFVSSAHHLVMVSDRGNFVSGQLIYDDAGRPLALIGVEAQAIQNSQGAPLPRAFSRDAEALDVIYREGRPAALRVGYENLTRVADFALTGNRPGGPAREIAVPEWLAGTRTNESLESLCIAPPASPIAGSTLLLTEGVTDRDGAHVGWFLGNRDKGSVSFRATPGLSPSDCAFLPNGDLLVLERGTGMLSFTMALRRVPADKVRPDTLMEGEVLLNAAGSGIDNMEGIAVHIAPGGETRITLVSDDNFNGWQRNLLLEFAPAE